MTSTASIAKQGTSNKIYYGSIYWKRSLPHGAAPYMISAFSSYIVTKGHDIVDKIRTHNNFLSSYFTVAPVLHLLQITGCPIAC